MSEQQSSAVSARPVAWFCFVDAPKDDPEPLRIRTWTADAERAKSIGQVIGRELEPLYRAQPQSAQAEKPATPQEIDEMHSALAELHDDLGRARDMIADVPGDNLHEALSNYIGSYMALQIEVQELRARCQAESVK